ncbi:alpha/beta hydrolase [Helicobacter sp. MIT 14-3879]|uniref:alpha/beta hydrolase n=1 Tax=Helicobacter sp. MIT 14-3879 TaxID=2040649 RepID=UPI0015F17FF2|nr:alpha/beta hydrolase-fold protein [Helicobacter sp. MIT 14-3879]
MNKNYLWIILFLISYTFAKPSQEIPAIKPEANEVFYISSINMSNTRGKIYKIHIALPKHNKDKNIFYTLDGNVFFPMLLNLIITNKKGFFKLPIIVGIGHNSPLAFDRNLRTKDYLPPLEGFLQSEFSGGGGASEFLEFITKKLQPFIYKSFGKPQKELLFGHSFGGIFVLYAIMNNWEKFTHYVSASPSLWWGYGGFVRNGLINLKNINAKILLTRGSLETQKLDTKQNPININDIIKTKDFKKRDFCYYTLQWQRIHIYKYNKNNSIFYDYSKDFIEEFKEICKDIKNHKKTYPTPTIKEVLNWLQLSSINPNNISFLEFKNKTHGSSIPNALISGIKILEE